MKKINQVKLLMGTLSLLLMAVVISCTRNLSVPVTAVVNTPTPASGTFTATSTPTGPTSTFTDTPTLTATNTPTGLPGTPTNTGTSTDTPTITNTPTITDTATITNTPTITNTATNTVAVPTATPSTFTDFDDMDSSAVWTGSFPSWFAGASAYGSATGVSNGVDATNFFTYPDGTSALCGTGNMAATPIGQSIVMTVGNFGAGSGPGQGYGEFNVYAVYPECNNGLNGSPVPLTAPGTTNTMSIQFLGTGGPVTIHHIYLDSSGVVDQLYATPDLGLVSGTWTNLVIPMSSLMVGSGGSLAHLESAGVAEVIIDITGPLNGSGSVNMDDIIFY